MIVCTSGAVSAFAPAGAVPAMTIDAVSAPYESPAEIHVVAHGTPLSGSYEVKYKPEPGTTVVMEPGSYDVLMKASSYGAGFVLVSDVAVRDGKMTHINPNVLLGGVAIIWVKWIAMLTVLLWFGSHHHAMVPRAVTHRRCRYHDRSGLLIVRDSTAC